MSLLVQAFAQSTGRTLARSRVPPPAFQRLIVYVCSVWLCTYMNMSELDGAGTASPMRIDISLRTTNIKCIGSAQFVNATTQTMLRQIGVGLFRDAVSLTEPQSGRY